VSPNNIDALHRLPAETLMRGVAAVRAANFQAQERYDLASKAITDWAPAVDGRTMLFDPTSPTVSSDVPLIIGNAQHEFYSALGHPEYVQMKELEARELVRTFFGPSGDDIYDVYKRAFPKVSPFEVSAMARATGRMRAASVKVAQRRSAFNAAPTYNYCVHWRANNFEGRGMAHHEVEMALVYLNSDAVPMATGGTAEARTLSLKMADSWLAFAHTGNPNTKALPNWNPVTPNAMTTMIFDNSCRMDHGSDLAAVEMAWKSRYPNG
jgi:para-nitrobenzyl esterase